MRSVNVTAVCAWCGQPFQRPPKGNGPGTRDYCCRLHYSWARAITADGCTTAGRVP